MARNTLLGNVNGLAKTNANVEELNYTVTHVVINHWQAQTNEMTSSRVFSRVNLKICIDVFHCHYFFTEVDLG